MTSTDKILNYKSEKTLLDEYSPSRQKALGAAKGLHLVEKLKSVNCQLLKTGYKPVSIYYYYCHTCDPDEKEPICNECARVCHERKNHKISDSYMVYGTCSCGLVCHNLSKKPELFNKKYSPSCTFIEWFNNLWFSYYYERKQVEGDEFVSKTTTNLCIFCYFMCEDSNENENIEGRSIRISYRQIRKKLTKCECSNQKHLDQKNIIKKISDLLSQNSDMDKLIDSQLVNLVFNSFVTFNTLYDSFIENLGALQKLIFEPDFYLDINQAYSGFTLSLTNFYNFASRIGNLYYINLRAVSLIDSDFLIKILEVPFETTSKSLWEIKYQIFVLFMKFNFFNYTQSLPSIEVEDLENFSPFQRMLTTSSIQDNKEVYAKFIISKNDSLLTKAIYLVELYNNMEDKNAFTFQILVLLFKLIKFFIKYYLAEVSDIIKVLNISEELLFSLQQVNKVQFTENLSQIQECCISIVYQVIQTIVYASYNYNDSVIKNCLEFKKDVKKIAFLHNECEIGLAINKNIVMIMNFYQHFRDLNISNKKLNKVMKYAMMMNNISLNNPDSYLVGLRRLLTSNNIHYNRFIFGSLTKQEEAILENLLGVETSIESLYFKFFNLEIDITDFTSKLINEIKNVIICLEISETENKDQRSPYNALPPKSWDQRSEAGIKRILINKTNIINSLFNSIVIFKKLYHIKDGALSPKVSGASLCRSVNTEEENFLDQIYKDISSIFSSNKTIIGYLKQPKDFQVYPTLINYLFDILNYYVFDSVDNSLIIFRKKFKSICLCLKGEQLVRMLIFIDGCLNFLSQNQTCTSNINSLLMILEYSIGSLTSKEIQLSTVNMILKIIETCSYVSFLNKKETLDYLRELLKMIYYAIPFFKNFIKQLKEDSEYSEVIAASKFKMCLYIEDQEESANLILSTFILYIKLINLHYDGNATLNEQDFLSTVLDKSDIPYILKKKNLPLSLRVEILRFFRMVFIDIIIDSDKILEYQSVFISPTMTSSENLVVEDDFTYQFYQTILAINNNNSNFAIESAIIKYELKYLTQILGGSGESNYEEMLYYIQEGIVLPLTVFINKFMSCIYLLKGREYLKLYSLVVYFLELKKYMLESKNMYAYLTKNNKFDQVSQDKSLFENETAFKAKRNEFVIKSHFSSEDHEAVIKDLATLMQPDFEVLNYKIVFSIYSRHLQSFILKPKNKSMLTPFLKREKVYSNDEILRMKEIVKDSLSNNSDSNNANFEMTILDLIIKYENDKTQLNECSFIKNLNEINHNLLINYRYAALKALFIASSEETLNGFYVKDSLWNIFRLLQYDTIATQLEVLNLCNNDTATTKFYPLINSFVQNLLSLIFSSCNPSSTTDNEDYYIAINILKILKYLCEDHNNFFQSIFFQDITFQHSTTNSEIEKFYKLSLFDLLVSIAEKIIHISNWIKVGFGSSENDISYFYDIFYSLIELCIEMVQGTTKQNLESLVKKKGDINIFLNSFLHSAKHILLIEKNDLNIIYQVKKTLVDFLVAIIEEKASPNKLILTMASIFNPEVIFKSIVNTLKKLYVKLSKSSNGKNESYESIIIDEERSSFFTNIYFSDVNLTEEYPEFELCKKLYLYVKILAVEYNNEDAKTILNLDKKMSELSKQSKHQYGSYNGIYNDSILQNYYTVKFFEKVFRTVYVVDSMQAHRVIYDINPMVNFLSENTKNEFLQSVNRESRYAKLYELMENCNHFYHEIIYNYNRTKDSKFLKWLNKRDYSYYEKICFCITLLINLFLLIWASTKSAGTTSNPSASTSAGHRLLNAGISDITFELTMGPQISTILIMLFAIISIILNTVLSLLWLYSKYPLYYHIELEKLKEKNKSTISNENSKDENVLKLSFIGKAKLMIWNSIILKNQINGFIWNIIFSLIGIAGDMKYYFVFSVQLLIVINLSTTLKNIVRSVTLRYKQMSATSLFLLVTLYVFSTIGFFFFNEDFIFEIEGAKENQCGSLLFCLYTLIDQGLRTDGGIGEYLKRISFNEHPGYFMARFFYDILYFFLVIIILLSIVVGIVIDNFAELKEESYKHTNDYLNICFICGVDRGELEKENIDFEQHVNNEHSIWNYVYYIVGLKFIHRQELNAVNSYVTTLVESKSISWFPFSQPKSLES